MVAHDPKTTPLVSCIMPTSNRRLFVPQAIVYFLRQDYLWRELIIVDDGDDSIKDLVPDDPRIHYLRLERKHSIGTKRNLACETATGEIIVHWDDDDWVAPWRLTYQVERLIAAQADICGLDKVLFYDAVSGCFRQYIYRQGRKLWLYGATLCYTKVFWERNRFPDMNVGEDARFIWSNRPKKIVSLEDNTFYVGLIHPGNTSPKQTNDQRWQPYAKVDIRKLMGEDWNFYAGLVTSELRVGVDFNSDTLVMTSHEQKNIMTISNDLSAATVRNVFACLVHEDRACVIDLVRNLRYFDPSSQILLYNGSEDVDLLKNGFPFRQYGAIIHPNSRPLKWGRLHDFALDCIRFALEHLSFDTLTIVDSDQLAIRANFSQYLAQFLERKDNVGLLSSAPRRQAASTTIPPAKDAHKEIAMWRPFLRRFPHGEDKFVYWSFWPSTVFTVDAARDLTRLFATDTQLQDIMSHTRIWATEEIVLPTLVALLGYKIMAHPCSFEYVKYRETYTRQKVNAALAQPDAYWVHPIARRYGDELRKHIRTRFNHYEAAWCGKEILPDGGKVSDLLLALPVLRAMGKIEGWLAEDEADLLIAVCQRALTTLPKPHVIVEVGSYCGKATVVLGSVAKGICSEAKVYAVDPHDGRVGALDQGITKGPPTLKKFERTIAEAQLTEVVQTIKKRASDVHWERPVTLLLIDGLHDYANVAQDFFHFEEWVVAGGYIAFHDYADYFPGVKAFVHELLASGEYRKVQCIRTLMVLQKKRPVTLS